MSFLCPKKPPPIHRRGNLTIFSSTRKSLQPKVCGGDSAEPRLSTSNTALSNSGILPNSVPSTSDETELLNPGILPDQKSSAPAPSNPGSFPDSMHGFEFWEIFAGCAKLSSCLQTEGFTIFPVDHDDMEHTPLVPLFCRLEGVCRTGAITAASQNKTACWYSLCYALWDRVPCSRTTYFISQEKNGRTSTTTFEVS